MKNLPQKEEKGFLLYPKKSIHNEKRALPVSGPGKVKFPRQNPDSVATKLDAKKKRVDEALKLYRETLAKLTRERRLNPENGTCWTVHLKTAKLISDQGKCVNTSKRFGHVPGINIGDEFLWRGELKIIGLHGQFINGIDYMRTPFGKLYATSIVDSGRYANDGGSTNTLVYCGQGENPTTKSNGKLKDQKLERGNLAMKNNMVEGVPVRVIRKIRRTGVGCADEYKFVYDGLYSVERYWQERGEFGKLVFKFLLNRLKEPLEHNRRKYSLNC